MPKRILDDSLLTSPSLAKCSPRAQDAFPRLILLADDFGCFEAAPRVLVGRGWPYRSDVTEDDVWGWLEEFVAAGMACLWTENERRWCYLTGWDGPHGQKQRVEYDPKTVKGRKGSKRKTPTPPPELVAAVRAGARRDHDGKPPGIDREPAGKLAQETINDSVPARDSAGTQPGNAISRPLPAYAVPVAVPDAGTTHTLPREAGAADRTAIDARHDDPPHPLMDAVVLALRAEGLKPLYPKNGARASVEATIAQVGVPVAVERIRAAWVVSKPWLTMYLEDIVPPPPKTQPKDPARGMAPVGSDWNARPSWESQS